MHWYIEGLKKYADFNGRASRTEFWMFTLCHIVILLVLNLSVESATGLRQTNLIQILVVVLALIYSLATIIPYFAILARRLHDIGKTGWLVLISFIPIIELIMIYFLCLESQPGTNEYGPSPIE